MGAALSRVDLPDGGWVELASPRKVSERKRRRYVAAMTDLNQSTQALGKNEKGEVDLAGFGPDQQTRADNVGDALMLALITAWSIEAPIDAESLADLPIDTFDTIMKACADLAPQLLPDFGVSPDPKAITTVSTP